MNRTAKTLAVILLTAFSYTMPIQACWWKSCDDWFNFEDDSGCDDHSYDDYAWDLMLDDLEVDGKDRSSDSFWNMGVYIERNLGRLEQGRHRITLSPQLPQGHYVLNISAGKTILRTIIVKKGGAE